MTRPKRKKSQRGVALLMVLIALTILGAMTADLMESSDVYVATTRNYRDSTRAEYLARSGVNLSRLLLSFQRVTGQTLNFPFWQYADMAIGMFVDSEGGGLAGLVGLDMSGAKGVGLGEGDMDLEVRIVDEDSKLNVNLANEGRRKNLMVEQLTQMMAPVEYDPLFQRQLDGGDYVERQEIICEMVDWGDPDETLCDGSGSEDPSFYQTLEQPYERKNAPFDSLEELHMVRGIGDDFWAAFVDPDPDDPDRRVMTVWGKGKINVNTAPPAVLFPIVCMVSTDESGVSPCMDPMQRINLLQILQGVVLYRTFMPFSSAKDFIQAVENPEERLFLPVPGFPILDKRNAMRVLTTQSTVFSIYAKGTVGNVTRRLHVVVDMEGNDMLNPGQSVAASGGSVLYWRMD